MAQLGTIATSPRGHRHIDMCIWTYSIIYNLWYPVILKNKLILNDLIISIRIVHIQNGFWYVL